jgi:RHS repeat-associated protein
MEKDDELKGEGNSYTTEFRQYDPRLGRWLSLDPLASQSPGWTPYRAFFNNPVIYTDPDGLYETKREARQARRGAKDAGYDPGKIRGSKGNYYFGALIGKGDNQDYELFKYKKFDIEPGQYKGGIEFYDAADARGAVPIAESHVREGFDIGMYRVVPYYIDGKLDHYVTSIIVRDPENLARETSRHDYIIGRDKLDQFEKNINPYTWASVLSFEQGAKLHLDQWQIDYANGKYGAAWAGKLKEEWTNPLNILDAVTSIKAPKSRIALEKTTFNTLSSSQQKIIQKMSKKSIRKHRR